MRIVRSCSVLLVVAAMTGSVVCTSAELFQAVGHPVLNVTFKAQWDAHP